MYGGAEVEVGAERGAGLRRGGEEGRGQRKGGGEGEEAVGWERGKDLR